MYVFEAFEVAKVGAGGGGFAAEAGRTKRYMATDTGGDGKSERTAEAADEVGPGPEVVGAIAVGVDGAENGGGNRAGRRWA